ncbi:MAG: MOSC domain-containing protein [Sciscionella sp.]
MTARVAELRYYPVKGCAGVSLHCAELGERGIHHDREFMVVSAADGAFVSQRRKPQLAAVTADFDARSGELSLNHPDAGPARFTVGPDGPRHPASLFDTWFGEGVDTGEAPAQWFSTVLGGDYRLLRITPEHDRDGWGATPGKVGFADAHALLITSSASLRELNRRIEQAGGVGIPMDRFRPNLVIAGWQEPHTEDDIAAFGIGSTELAYAVRCIRCAVPTVDQRTGRRAGPEPTRTLARYRREPQLGGGVSFGLKAAVVRSGAITVGDEIRVLRRGEPQLALS